MRRSFGSWPWKLALALLTGVFGARAQDGRLVAVEWSAPPGCPGSDVVEQRVTELAGAISRVTPLSAKGQVSVVDGGVALHLETQDAGETFVRDVQLPTCEQAAETAALILAMAVRAELTPPLGEPGASSTSPNTPASVPAPPPAAPPLVSSSAAVSPLTLPAVNPTNPEPPPAPGSPTVVPRASRSIQVVPPPKTPSEVEQGPPPLPPASTDGNAPTGVPAPRAFAASAAGSVVWGLVPSALWALTVHGAWLPLPWRLEVTGAFAPSQRFSLASDPTRGGEFVWWSAGARGCYVLQQPRTSSPFGALVCAGAEAGQLRGKGFGTTLSEEGVSAWAAINAGLGGILELSDYLNLLARMEVAAPLRRDRFVLQNTEDSGLVARAGPLLGKLSVGIEAEF